MAPPPPGQASVYVGLRGVVFRYWVSRFSGYTGSELCVWLLFVGVIAVRGCERVREFVVRVFVNVHCSDTVTALHRGQAPCSYMQVTVAAPPFLPRNDRKPRDQSSRRRSVSAGEERAEAGEKRFGKEPLPPPLPWAAAQEPLPHRRGGGEARDGTGRMGWWSRGKHPLCGLVTPKDAVKFPLFW